MKEANRSGATPSAGVSRDAARVGQWCIDNQDELQRLLIRMVLAYSPAHLGSETECMEIVREELHGIGGAGEIGSVSVPAARLESHPSYVDVGSMNMPDYRNRPNLAAAFHKGRIDTETIRVADFCAPGPLPGSLLLNGHVDVVELAEEGWTRRQGEVAENRIYGRGSLDMKGGLAAAIFVLKAFRETGTPLAMPVLLEAVVDEEGGGNGTLINRIAGIKAEQALIPEPTSTFYCCPASVGAHFFRLKLVDPSAKTIAQQFETANLLECVSPFARLVGQYARLRQKEIDHPLYAAYELVDRVKASCALCKVKGGDWPSTLPYKIEMEGSVECVPGETLEQMRLDFETYLSRRARELRLPEHSIEWFGLRFPPSSIDPDHPWVRRVVEAARPIVTRNPAFEAGPLVVGAGGSDLRLFHEYGIPAVLYGPGGDNAHGVDEYVEIDQLVDFCLILANLLAEPVADHSA